MFKIIVFTMLRRFGQHFGSIVIASLRPPRLVGQWCEQHIRQDVNWPNSVSAFRSRFPRTFSQKPLKIQWTLCEKLPKLLQELPNLLQISIQNGAKIVQNRSLGPSGDHSVENTSRGRLQGTPWTSQSRPKYPPTPPQIGLKSVKNHIKELSKFQDVFRMDFGA